MLYIQILLSILGLYFNLDRGNAKSTEHLRPTQLVIDSASINSDYLIVKGKTIAANEMPNDINSYQWYLLAKNEKRQIFLKKIATPKSGIYPKNSLDIGKNWNFSIPDSLSEYFIIGKKNGKLPETDHLYMFDNISLKISDLNQRPELFFFNYKNYYMGISGERDYKREEEISESIPHYVITNYRLTLASDIDNFTKEISLHAKKQVVIEQASYIYDGVHIIWIGDIDGDENPDIISPIENSPNGYDIALFLSSEAKGKNLVKLVAHYKPCSC